MKGAKGISLRRRIKAEAKKRRTQSDAEQDHSEAIAQRVAALIQNAPQQAAPQQAQLIPRRREMISSAGDGASEGGFVGVRSSTAPGMIQFRENEYEAVLDSIGRAARSARHAERLCEQAAQSFKAEATALESVREHLAVQMYQAQLRTV